MRSVLRCTFRSFVGLAGVSIASALVASQAGGRLPEISAPVLFDTPEADRILSALQILPPDNPWHEDITNRPVHAMSAAIVRSIGADARSDTTST